jgi:hypothetical protein
VTIVIFLAWVGILLLALLLSFTFMVAAGLTEAADRDNTFACTLIGFLGGFLFCTTIYLHWRCLPALSTIWE